jgi:molybdopterin-containing oxidoreductase family membrane subunit
MNRTTYSEIEGHSKSFYALAAVLALFVLCGFFCAYYMEHYGHYITGMSNQVVWGIPHVFAIFLIVAASGALNIASIGSVFGKRLYQPLGRFSGLLALALLVGGLVVLVLDLGRPDLLIVAMTHYNFSSVFAWNVFLYIGFMLVIAVYLWVQMERRMNRHVRAAARVAFIWRLVLTTGTGCIFGFIVAREAWHPLIMAPLFIAMSFAFGLAVYLLALLAACKGSNRDIGDVVVRRMGRLLAVQVTIVLGLTVIQHATNLLVSENVGVERFILLDGGNYTLLFWLGQVVTGSLVPMVLLFRLREPQDPNHTVSVASALVILGGFVQLYVLVIGGQAYPLNMFPGMEITSGFFDGVVAGYTPSLPEIGLALGGVALTGLIVLFGIKLLRFLPVSLANAAIDPHHVPHNGRV